LPLHVSFYPLDHLEGAHMPYFVQLPVPILLMCVRCLFVWYMAVRRCLCGMWLYVDVCAVCVCTSMFVRYVAVRRCLCGMWLYVDVCAVCGCMSMPSVCVKFTGYFQRAASLTHSGSYAWKSGVFTVLPGRDASEANFFRRPVPWWLLCLQMVCVQLRKTETLNTASLIFTLSPCMLLSYLLKNQLMHFY
jgi:hypothetical protein